METLKLLRKLEELLEHPPRIASMFGKAMIDQEQALNMIHELRHSLPEDLVKADSVVKRREAIMADARQEADNTRTEAQDEADRLVTDARETSEKRVAQAIETAEDKITQAADEAERILAEANAERKRLISDHDVLAEARKMAQVREEKARRESEEMRERAIGYVKDLLREAQDRIDQTQQGIADALAELDGHEEIEPEEIES